MFTVTVGNALSFHSNEASARDYAKRYGGKIGKVEPLAQDARFSHRSRTEYGRDVETNAPNVAANQERANEMGAQRGNTITSERNPTFTEAGRQGHNDGWSTVGHGADTDPESERDMLERHKRELEAVGGTREGPSVSPSTRQHEREEERASGLDQNQHEEMLKRDLASCGWSEEDIIAICRELWPGYGADSPPDTEKFNQPRVGGAGPYGEGTERQRAAWQSAKTANTNTGRACDSVVGVSYGPVDVMPRERPNNAPPDYAAEDAAIREVERLRRESVRRVDADRKAYRQKVIACDKSMIDNYNPEAFFQRYPAQRWVGRV
jgi:hypothetical protein